MVGGDAYSQSLLTKVCNLAGLVLAAIDREYSSMTNPGLGLHSPQ